MRFGVLTGALRGVVYRAARFGHTTEGFLDGWKGVRDDLHRPLTPGELAESVTLGGTVLGTSRTNPFKSEADAEKVLATLGRHGIDVLVAIGGDDTLTAARELGRRGGKVVGVPKTMDNDVAATDWTFGFDSASSVAMDAVERLRDTARSHHRAIVLEVMGRDAGWVALATGLSAGADATLVPEESYQEAKLMEQVRRAHGQRGYAVIVASEGIDLPLEEGGKAEGDQFGHALLRERGVGAWLAKRIEGATGIETRSAQIGHIQRGGPPTLFDRILATRLGSGAVDLALAGKFGHVAALKGGQVVGVTLDEATRSTKVVDASWLDLLHTFDA